MKCRNCGKDNRGDVRYCVYCGSNLYFNPMPTKKRRSPLLYIGVILLVLILAVGGALAYIVYFDTSPVEVTTLNNNGANILSNSEIASNLPNSNITSEIVKQAGIGTPIYKIGDGKGPVTVITAGVHGDQLNPSVAAMRLVNYLSGRKIKGTIYVLPFTSPEAISQNTKLTNGVNLNTAADESGSISYDVVQFARNHNALAVGDFHETGIGKNPGVTTIMCTKSPTIGSYELANNMSLLSLDTTLTYQVAGITYDGAIEDELNLLGTPAVTPLVLVPGHSKVYKTSVDESYTQMLALLYVNGNLNATDNYLKLANMNIDGL